MRLVLFKYNNVQINNPKYKLNIINIGITAYSLLSYQFIGFKFRAEI